MEPSWAAAAGRRGAPASTPLLAYRWEHTDRALSEQLALEDDGHRVTVEPGHAAVRYTNPATAGDALPTIRAEFHRFRPGARQRRRAGTSDRRCSRCSTGSRGPGRRGDVAGGSWRPLRGAVVAAVDGALRRHGCRPVPLLRRPRLRAPRPAPRADRRVAGPRVRRMKLATIRIPDGVTRAVRLDGDVLVDLGVAGCRRAPRRARTGPSAPRRSARGVGGWAIDEVGRAPVLPHPGKIVCVGSQLPVPHPRDGS